MKITKKKCIPLKKKPNSPLNEQESRVINNNKKKRISALIWRYQISLTAERQHVFFLSLNGILLNFIWTHNKAMAFGVMWSSVWHLFKRQRYPVLVIRLLFYGCGHINFQWFLCLLIFGCVITFRKYDFIKLFALQLLTWFYFWPKCIRFLVCVYICAIYHKRQQYRVDLIAKIIFIYGFPFYHLTVGSLYFYLRQLALSSFHVLRMGFTKWHLLWNKTKHFGD